MEAADFEITVEKCTGTRIALRVAYGSGKRVKIWSRITGYGKVTLFVADMEASSGERVDISKSPV